MEWQRPLDSWLLENGCTRQTCFLTVTYEGLQDGQWIAPDGYLFLNNFNQVTNLAQADVKVKFGPYNVSYDFLLLFKIIVRL